MPIRVEEIDSSKLRVVFRGFDQEHTDELLRRVAWDYLQVTRKQEVWADHRLKLEQRVAELEAEVNSQRDEFTRALAERDRRAEEELRARGAAHDAEVEQLQRSLREHEGRDEMTRALLTAAQRSARGMRESVRSECDALLKTAHRLLAPERSRARVHE